ncbi:MAG: hypothetical protein CMH62_03245 [Nanoarchaeota archaeon]|nr:hypothetical protein [Nanoarchaeota archaeon]|tara:strand:+ start:670 stop:1308 length:639 start_codon:yes stop_codon:yes gene_type:complete
MFKKNDFIEIELTAKVKETGLIFETTDEATAKENNFHNSSQKYAPKIICLGQHQILPSLEEELENKELNKEFEVELPPERAFGKKNPKLLQLVSASQFKKQNITPYPGLHVNVDNSIGVVRTASPGRVIVDFNNPLSGRNIIYKIKILKLITDTKEKIISILDSYHLHNANVEIADSNLTIKAKVDENIQKEITRKILELVPIIKKINVVKE